ncbi:MAG TPA: hypothetical protein VFZ21_27595, partial [Gemmatimonadaceae bacterium]|nr:hypothetical protein [Gemmatimonadaceae bacterium]
RDPLGRAFGWSDLARVANARQRETEARTGRRTWLGADRYQEASEVAFHAAGQPTTFAVNLSGRRNQYDLWPRFPQAAQPGDNLVLALDETDETHSTVVKLQPYFAAHRRLDLVPLRRDEGVIGHRRLWVLEGWKSGWPE